MKPMKLEDYLTEARKTVGEIFPWDLKDRLDNGDDLLLVDIREPYEFEKMHIPFSRPVPRGILETAVDFGYEDTREWLVESRKREIVVICRSGNRSLLGGKVMQEMGFENVVSLKTGVRGWADSDYPLVDPSGREIPPDESEKFFYPNG